MRKGPPGWRQRAHALKAANPERTYASIGNELGVTPSAVAKALNPERASGWNRISNAKRNDAKRAWERDPRNRGYCSECGALLQHAARIRDLATGLCQPCELGLRTMTRIVRESLIVGMYLDGWSLREIAATLDSTVSSVGSAISQMRARGEVIPHRNNVSTEGLRRMSEAAKATRAREAVAA